MMHERFSKTMSRQFKSMHHIINTSFLFSNECLGYRYIYIESLLHSIFFLIIYLKNILSYNYIKIFS